MSADVKYQKGDWRRTRDFSGSSLQNTQNLNLRNKNNGLVFTSRDFVNSVCPPRCRKLAPWESLSLRQIITFSVLSLLPGCYHFTLLLKLT